MSFYVLETMPRGEHELARTDVLPEKGFLERISQRNDLNRFANKTTSRTQFCFQQSHTVAISILGKIAKPNHNPDGLLNTFGIASQSI